MPLFGGAGNDRRKPVPPAAGGERPALVEGDPGHDALTGLLSRDAIEAEGTFAIEATAAGEHVAIAYIGFDGLRALSDRAGNLVGDQLLRELGKRLRNGIRECDYVGRLNSDEFLIVFRKLNGRLETLALVSRLRITLAEPIAGGTGPYKPIVNCGLAHPPADGAAIALLLDVAEKAMLANREQAREAARRDAGQRLEAAHAAVASATAERAAAEQGVREAEKRLDLAKAGLTDAKSAAVAATAYAKSLGIVAPEAAT